MSEGTGAQKSAQNTTQARSGITGDQIHESQAHTSHATKDSEEFEPGIHLEPSEGTFGWYKSRFLVPAELFSSSIDQGGDF